MAFNRLWHFEEFWPFFSFAYIFCGKIVAKKILILVVQNWLKIKSVKVPYLYDISVANYQASKCVGIMWLISLWLTIMFWLHFTSMRARNNQIVSNFQNIDFIWKGFRRRGNFVVISIICGDNVAFLKNEPWDRKEPILVLINERKKIFRLCNCSLKYIQLNREGKNILWKLCGSWI